MPFLPERCRHPPSSRWRLSPVRREKLPGTHSPRLFAVRLRLVMLLPARAPRVFPPLAPFMVELFAAALFLQAVAGSCHLPDALVTKSVLPTPAYVERSRTIRELSPQGGFEASKENRALPPLHLRRPPARFRAEGLSASPTFEPAYFQPGELNASDRIAGFFESEFPSRTTRRSLRRTGRASLLASSATGRAQMRVVNPLLVQRLVAAS